MIDPHVHLRDWNQKHKETIAHGFTIAAGAGIRALYEMPNTDPTLTDYQRIKERVDYAGEEIGKADVSGPCEIHTPVKGMIQAKKGGMSGTGSTEGSPQTRSGLMSCSEPTRSSFPSSSASRCSPATRPGTWG